MFCTCYLPVISGSDGAKCDLTGHNRLFCRDWFAPDCVHRHHSTYLYHWINGNFGQPISSNIPGPFRSVRQLALLAETIWCRLAESPSADVSFSPFGGTTVSGNRRHFLVEQGETRTETPCIDDGEPRCLSHGGRTAQVKPKTLRCSVQSRGRFFH